MVGATKNAQFHKALRMIENDVWNNMLHGKNKVTSLDCSIKHFSDAIYCKGNDPNNSASGI